MTVSINDVPELWDSLLDGRDKGDKFERPVQTYLKADLELAHRFTDVWPWSEWPGREGRPDTGIDQVAANRDGHDFAALQREFYEPGHKAARADIDSFISASARKAFTERIVFNTAAVWSGKGQETLYGVAHRVDISYMTDAAIDWDQYSWHTLGVVVPGGKKPLRLQQQQALDDVRAGQAVHDRIKLIVAWPHPVTGLELAPSAGQDPYGFCRVKKMRFTKRDERGSIVYNDRIIVSGMFEDFYRHKFGPRSTIEWTIDRYRVKTEKPSGIANDPNDWSREVGDPRHVLDLLARVVTVSLDTLRMVDGLPPLAIMADRA